MDVGPIIGFMASTVVAPLGLKALGLSPRLMFAISLAATIAVAFFGYPEWQGVSFIALIVSIGFSIWAAMNERGPQITFRYCRSQIFQNTGLGLRLRKFQLGAHLINDSGKDLWTSLVEEVWTIGDQAAAASPLRKTTRFYAGAKGYVISNGVLFEPPILLDPMPAGRVRWVIKYGTREDKLTKTLTISTHFTVQLQPAFDTVLHFVPDRDADAPTDDVLERLPT